jgi:hypothetical protein
MVPIVGFRLEYRNMSSVAQSPIRTPYQEYLSRWNEINMHFLAHPLRLENGLIAVPGANMDLDPAKIESEVEVTV